MLKRTLLALIILLPFSTLAAFNDTTLTTDVIISVGGYTLNISGSSAVLESVTVSSTHFSVTLVSGSSITIVSPTRNRLETDITTGVTNTCNSTESSLAITGTGTITITPSITVCVDATPVATPTPSGGGSSSSGSQVSPWILQQLLVSTPQKIKTNSFTRTLATGQKGTDVKTLQQYLNSKGFTVSTSGVGSKGNETTMFGSLTRAALARFQKANNIYPAVGFFGPITKAFINSHP